MQNILNETPEGELVGRFATSVQFVENSDVEGKEILDIGCGYGWCEVNFLARGAKKITGIEIAEQDLETIKKNITDPRLELRVASATTLPFPANSFDTVVCWEVIEHIPKGTEEEMFSEIYRVLRPGGAFYLSTPFASFRATLLDPAWWILGHRHYSRFQLAKYGKKNGLKVEEMIVRGGWWNIFSILNMYICKWILRKWMLMSEFFVRKENAEYESGLEGFTNIFAKYRK